MFVDPIARTIYTVLFLLLVAGLVYLGARVCILKVEVSSLNNKIVEQNKIVEDLNSKLDECKVELVKLDDANGFLRLNLKRLNNYYRRPPKPPVVSNGVFNKDNLFPVEPR